METNSQLPAFDPQISALLDCNDETVSIVDRLMCMPLEAGDTQSHWDRAVARRLERRLSDSMRGLLEAPDPRTA